MATTATTPGPIGSPLQSSRDYFALLAPGFNRQLNGSPTCVPRNNGATLKALYAGNAKANPQGWLLISWNGITEGTYMTSNCSATAEPMVDPTDCCTT